MTETNPPYIVPIFQNGNFIGSGFIVGSTLVTAKHVGLYGSGWCLSAAINGKQRSLFTHSAVSYDNIDTIIFRLPNVEVDSPLQFASQEPVYDNNEGKAVSYISKHFQPTEDGHIIYRETECLVIGETPYDEGRFYGFNKDETTHGASGSPLIKDNLVYGMLVGGIKYQIHNADDLIKEAVATGEMTAEQAKFGLAKLNNNDTYIKGWILKQVYERDFLHRPNNLPPQ